MHESDLDQIERLIESQNESADRVMQAISSMPGGRTSSKAALIGMGRPNVTSAYLRPGESDGAWITALVQARSRDASVQGIGKAALEAMGSVWADVPTEAKATLGDTAAAGGNIIPPNVLETIERSMAIENPYRRLVTVRTAGNTSGVDVPFANYAGFDGTRAGIVAPGATKPNLDRTYSKYSATMYTLARIYDVGNQLLRHSAGSAEADVRTELTSAIAAGERYYMISGSGTGEPYGLQTALTALPAFTSTFASASTTTVAGSLVSAVAVTLGALAGRGRTTDLTAIVSPTTYATAISEGSDTAGFWFSGLDGAAGLPGWPPGTLTIFGVPFIVDPLLTGKGLIVGQFRELKLYLGQTFRIDVSDTAGTRWDTNVTGFRGEEELAYDARPAVLAGAFQQITAAVP